MRGVDQDHPHHIFRVGGGIEPGDEAADGVTDEDIGARYRGCRKQGVQISNELASGAKPRRGGNGVTRVAGAARNVGPIVAADAGSCSNGLLDR